MNEAEEEEKVKQAASLLSGPSSGENTASENSKGVGLTSTLLKKSKKAKNKQGLKKALQAVRAQAAEDELLNIQEQKQALLLSAAREELESVAKSLQQQPRAKMMDIENKQGQSSQLNNQQHQQERQQQQHEQAPIQPGTSQQDARILHSSLTVSKQLRSGRRDIKLNSHAQQTHLLYESKARLSQLVSDESLHFRKIFEVSKKSKIKFTLADWDELLTENGFFTPTRMNKDFIQQLKERQKILVTNICHLSFHHIEFFLSNNSSERQT
jgi:hypothetical protein